MVLPSRLPSEIIILLTMLSMTTISTVKKWRSSVQESYSSSESVGNSNDHPARGVRIQCWKMLILCRKLTIRCWNFAFKCKKTLRNQKDRVPPSRNPRVVSVVPWWKRVKVQDWPITPSWDSFSNYKHRLPCVVQLAKFVTLLIRKFSSDAWHSRFLEARLIVSF